MKIELIGIDLKVSDELKQRIETKLSKFHRFFGDEALCTVKMQTEASKVRVELSLRIQKHLYRAEAVDFNTLQALDSAVDIMEGQIRKHKTRIKRKKHQYAYLKDYLDQGEALVTEEDKVPEIIRRKSFTIERMDAEAAVLQMELLNHGFYLFQNDETGQVALVYKRNDGNFGLIEPNY